MILKKIHILLLSVILIVFLCMSCISAGFFDGFFGEDTKDSEIKSEFIDVGTSLNSSSDWLVLRNVSKNIDENGTTISAEGDSGVYANKPSTSIGWNETYVWSTPFTIEFDTLKWSGDPSIRIAEGNNEIRKSFDELNISNGSHVKIISNTSDLTYIVDGKVVDKKEKSLTNAQIGFRLINATVEYKNFKIY